MFPSEGAVITELLVSFTGIAALLVVLATKASAASIPLRSRRGVAIGGTIFWIGFIVRQITPPHQGPLAYLLLMLPGAFAGIIAVWLPLLAPKKRPGYPEPPQVQWRPAIFMVALPAVGATLYLWATGLKSPTMSQTGMLVGLCLMGGAVLGAIVISRRRASDSGSSPARP